MTTAAPAVTGTATAPGRIWFGGLGYALVVLLTGTNLATPLYAAYEHVFHLSPLDVTLLVAVYAAAVMVALLAGGPVSDTAGYRPVLAAGLVTAAVGLLATHLGLTRSVQASAAVLAAACLLTMITGGRAGRTR